MIIFGQQNGTHYAEVSGVRYHDGDYCLCANNIRLVLKFGAGVPVKIKYDPVVAIIH